MSITNSVLQDSYSSDETRVVRTRAREEGPYTLTLNVRQELVLSSGVPVLTLLLHRVQGRRCHLESWGRKCSDLTLPISDFRRERRDPYVRVSDPIEVLDLRLTNPVPIGKTRRRSSICDFPLGDQTPEYTQGDRGPPDTEEPFGTGVSSEDSCYFHGELVEPLNGVSGLSTKDW